MNLLKKILFIKEKKPVTQEELDQLELVAKKEELNAKIAEARAKQNKNKVGIMEKVLGKSNSNPFSMDKSKGGDIFNW